MWPAAPAVGDFGDFGDFGDQNKHQICAALMDDLRTQISTLE